MNNRERQLISRRGRTLTVSAVLATGILLSLITAHLLRTREEQLHDVQFRSLCESRVATITRELGVSIEVLHSVAAFFAGSERVDAEEFHTFGEPFLARRQNIMALEWAPRVDFSQREQFEKAISSEAGTTIVISEMGTNHHLETAGIRAEYYPVRYLIQPIKTEFSSVGFDHSAESVRWKAMSRAMDTGQPIATERVQLFRLNSASEYRRGILVALPIYENGSTPVTLDARREQLIGFVLGIFRISDIVTSGLSLLPEAGLDFRITDNNSGTGLHVHRSAGEPVDRERSRFEFPPARGATKRHGRYYSEVVDVSGRSWQFDFLPTQELETEYRNWTSTIALAAGFMTTILIGGYVSLLGGRAESVERLVEQRTTDWQIANEKLAREIDERGATEQRLASHVTKLAEANQRLTVAREELDATVRELESKNRELDEFAYVASHDLQEPLRKLISFSELLQSDAGEGLNDDATRDLEYIVDAAKRMRQLVQDLLKLSKSGRSTLQIERVSLDECVDRALEAVSFRIDETGATIIRSQLPSVDGDPVLLTQLFQNLIGNALKFTTEETPVVRITTQLEDDFWVIGVADNGIGIKSEYAERIFKPFQRLHARNEYEGTGIGLAICRTNIDRLGGRLWLEPDTEQGCHFKFSLPASSKPVPREQPLETRSEFAIPVSA